MKKMLLRSLPVALFAIFLAGVPADASTITFQDTFDPADVFMAASSSIDCAGTNGIVDTVAPSGTCRTLSYSHLLTGYPAPPNVLQSASLTVYFRDDGGHGDGSEKFTLTGDGSGLWTAQEPGNSGTVAFGPLSVFAQVVSDGALSILVTAATGDLYFVKSVLDAEWLERDSNEHPVPTPEPASLLLFGAGAIFVGHRIRKAKAS